MHSALYSHALKVLVVCKGIWARRLVAGSGFPCSSSMVERISCTNSNTQSACKYVILIICDVIHSFAYRWRLHTVWIRFCWGCSCLFSEDWKQVVILLAWVLLLMSFEIGSDFSLISSQLKGQIPKCAKGKKVTAANSEQNVYFSWTVQL